jgi:predicted GIY-YIG superfamily endonuclease
MHTVYILKSIAKPGKSYIGITQDLDRRLEEHNSGLSQYTKKFIPWEVETYIVFKNKLLAERFERYLKAGSGQAFLTKHLLAK